MFAALALLVAMQPAPTQAPASHGFQPLTVIVRGVRSARGHVRVELCRAETFLGRHCDVIVEAPAKPGEVTLTVPDLPAGRYAIQAYHDANDDHTVDRNLIGLPVEEFGFSRSPPLGLHGPSFSRAAFVHDGEGPQAVTVQLRGLF